MEEKEASDKEPIEYILETILELISQDRRANVRDTNDAREPMEIHASAEEGARLIRAFIGIKQPGLRAAIIKLATEMADVKASTQPVQS
jgi:hypothetical protein